MTAYHGTAGSLYGPGTGLIRINRWFPLANSAFIDRRQRLTATFRDTFSIYSEVLDG
jgi:hypothetical protein